MIFKKFSLLKMFLRCRYKVWKGEVQIFQVFRIGEIWCICHVPQTGYTYTFSSGDVHWTSYVRQALIHADLKIYHPASEHKHRYQSNFQPHSSNGLYGLVCFLLVFFPPSKLSHGTADYKDCLEFYQKILKAALIISTALFSAVYQFSPLKCWENIEKVTRLARAVWTLDFPEHYGLMSDQERWEDWWV